MLPSCLPAVLNVICSARARGELRFGSGVHARQRDATTCVQCVSIHSRGREPDAQAELRKESKRRESDTERKSERRERAREQEGEGRGRHGRLRLTDALIKGQLRSETLVREVMPRCAVPRTSMREWFCLERSLHDISDLD